MYAIVVIKGKQYKAEVGQIITTDKVEGNVGDKVSFGNILLTNDGSAVKVGTPFVDGVKAVAEITAQGKGPKVRVSKFKAKVRYRRTTGHRHALTELKVLSLGGSTKSTIKAKPEEKKKPVKAKKTS